MLCKSSMQKYTLAQIPKHLLNTYYVYKPHYRHIDLISACVSWSTLSTTLGLVRGTLLYIQYFTNTNKTTVKLKVTVSFANPREPSCFQTSFLLFLNNKR